MISVRMSPVAFAALIALASCSNKPKEKPAAADEPAASDAAPAPIGAETPVPRLIEAIREVQPSQLASLKRATAACRLLEAEPAPAARDAVFAAVTRPLPKLDPGHAVRAACARTLGAYGDDGAVDTLLTIIGDSGEMLAVRVGAMDGLAHAGDPRAIEPILTAVVRSMRLFDAARAALAAIGEPAVAPLSVLLATPPDGIEPGTSAFVAARALGDLRATAAVPALVASLETRPMPAMFDRKGEAGPTHHVAVIEALQKIGGADAAKALRAYQRRTTEPSLATLAYDAFGWVAEPGADLDRLRAVLADGGGDRRVRIAAGLAYARLAKNHQPLVTLAEGYAGQGDAGHVWYSLTAGLIARARVGTACAGKPACLAGLVAAPDDELVAAAAAVVPAPDQLSDANRAGLAAATRERALLDLARAGTAARPHLPVILGAAGSDQRLVRAAALRALLAVAERPCASCVEALDGILDQETGSNPVAQQMRLDTEVARNLLRPR